jgi:hypothetical protein
VTLRRDILPSAEARWATERENHVARPRWQNGLIFKRGKKTPVWIGRFREDAIAGDGSRLRIQRSVVLGLVSELGRRDAQRRLSERLGAINQGRHKPELLATFETLWSKGGSLVFVRLSAFRPLATIAIWSENTCSLSLARFDYPTSVRQMCRYFLLRNPSGSLQRRFCLCETCSPRFSARPNGGDIYRRIRRTERKYRL